MSRGQSPVSPSGEAGKHYSLSLFISNNPVLQNAKCLQFPNLLSKRRSRYHACMDYRKVITIEPGKRGGKPCIRGLRITVYDVLDYLASGMTEAEILHDFPELTSDDIKACLAFAADRERRLTTVPA